MSRALAWWILVLALALGGAFVAAADRAPHEERVPLGLRVVALGAGCEPETLPGAERFLFPGLYADQRQVWGPRGFLYSADLAVAWVPWDGQGGGGRLVDVSRLDEELRDLEASLPEQAVVALFALPGSNELRPWSDAERELLAGLGATLVADGTTPTSWALLLEWNGVRFAPLAELRQRTSAGLLAFTHRRGELDVAPLRVDR